MGPVSKIPYRQARPTSASLSRTLPVIPAQNPRDLFYREAAHQHVAQLGQLRLGPFPFGVHGRLFVLSRGALRINDRGPNDAE
jgi:hypothetical protein